MNEISKNQDISKEAVDVKEGIVGIKKNVIVKSKIWRDPNDLTDPLTSVCASICLAQENEASSDSFTLACDDAIYGQTCDSDSLDANDGIVEAQNAGAGQWAGVRTRNNDTTVTDCASIDKVEVCVEVWLSSDLCQRYELKVAKNDSAISNFQVVNSSCPGTTANPGIVCMNVTDTFSWSCEDFFDGVPPSAGIISHFQRAPFIGSADTINHDVLYFNVTYTKINVAPFGGNASINLTSEQYNAFPRYDFVCINATAHDPDGDAITVRARIYNNRTNEAKNYTLLDNGIDCDSLLGDNVYSYKFQPREYAGYNWTHLIVNDSYGNFNQSIVNIRFNTTSLRYATDDVEIRSIELATGNEARISYFKFPLWLPSNIKIVKADMIFYVQSVLGTPAITNFYNCSSAWSEGSSESTIRNLPCSFTNSSSITTTGLKSVSVLDAVKSAYSSGDANITFRLNVTSFKDTNLLDAVSEIATVGYITVEGENIYTINTSEAATGIAWLNITYTAANNVPTVYLTGVDDDFNPLRPSEIDLVALSTKEVICNGTATDLDGGVEIVKVNATFYDSLSSSSNAADNNATHYTNQSCWLSSPSGNNRYFECIFRVRYFANNATWICNATAYDVNNAQSSNTTKATINQLLALSIDEAFLSFGLLPPGKISKVNKTNITNAGNVAFNLTIYGYANNATDSPNAMNCTLGKDKNISLYYLRYNVTDNIGGGCTTFGWTSNYWNLTNITNAKKWAFNLGKQTSEGVLARNITCFILRVPSTDDGLSNADVGGVCKGIISFAAFIGPA